MAIAAVRQSVEARFRDSDDMRWAVRHWAARIGVRVLQVHVREMTTKWASISTQGRLTLDTDLLDIAKDLAEFVIVHELVHLLAPNHGKVFKSFMLAYMPDWEEREKRLKAVSDLPSGVGQCKATPGGKIPTSDAPT